MKLLNPKNYSKLLEPLNHVSINSLFARSVIEGHVSGKVFVDDLEAPQSFYVLHPYGMSLLFGNCNNAPFNESFRDYSLNTSQERTQHEWMQAFPHDWHPVLEKLWSDKILLASENKEQKETGIIERNTRVNFKFDLATHARIKESYTPPGFNVVRTDKKIFNLLRGNVVPSHFWDTAEDFLTRGAGFSVYHQNQVAATAYASFVHENQFELGIETVSEFRGKGFAFHACMALLDYCLKNNYEPIWACRLENIGSYRLALKLGFKPILEIPYYKLSK